MDAKSLNEALVKQFPRPGDNDQCQAKDELLDQLFSLQTAGVETKTMLDNLRSDQLDPFHFALISFLDQQITERVNDAHLPAPVAGKLRGVVASVMRIAIADGVLAMTKSPIIPITEALLALTYGWTDLRGKALESTEQKLNDAIQSLIVATGAMNGNNAMIDARNNLLDLLEGDIVRYVSNERDRIRKLEQRLADSASGLLTAGRSKQQAISMLNDRMKGKLLPPSIVTFLQGVWFDSLQLIATRQGADSDEWYRAVQLTETLISTLQQTTGEEAPEEEPPTIDTMLEHVALDVEIEAMEGDTVPEPKAPEPDPGLAQPTNQQLYRIIEHLPAELRSCLVAIEHDQEAITTALASIEDAHVKVMKSERLETAPFDLIVDDSEPSDTETRVSQSLLAPVTKLNVGDWFVFQEDSGEAKHIKVTLKSDDSHHLIFTNRNGSSALQTSFEEFAYLISSGTVTALPLPGELLKNVRRNLMASLKAKAKEDEIASARQQRQAAESLAQSIESTQFLLVSISKKEVESEEPIQLDPEKVRAALKGNGEGSNLIYIDQTDELTDLPEDEVIKFALGSTLEVEDEMPVGMTDFKAAVERMRSHTKLVMVDADD